MVILAGLALLIILAYYRGDRGEERDISETERAFVPEEELPK
jgi:hypothetical protein